MRTQIGALILPEPPRYIPRPPEPCRCSCHDAPRRERPPIDARDGAVLEKVIALLAVMHPDIVVMGAA
jgi:hypothetical protein